VIVVGVDPRSGNNINVPYKLITAAARTGLPVAGTPER
jgi:hypothetical protein